MTAYPWTALVSLLALLLYFYMGLRVGRGRGTYNIEAPAVSGHPEFEKAFRIHANTLEWLPLFLVSLWLFAFWWSDALAAAIGAVWIIGRILYLVGYTRAPSARGPGFGVQALATAALLFGALGHIIANLVTHA